MALSILNLSWRTISGCSLFYSRHLEGYLAHSRPSRNICWMNNRKKVLSTLHRLSHLIFTRTHPIGLPWAEFYKCGDLLKSRQTRTPFLGHTLLSGCGSLPLTTANKEVRTSFRAWWKKCANKGLQGFQLRRAKLTLFKRKVLKPLKDFLTPSKYQIIRWYHRIQ